MADHFESPLIDLSKKDPNYFYNIYMDEDGEFYDWNSETAHLIHAADLGHEEALEEFVKSIKQPDLWDMDNTNKLLIDFLKWSSEQGNQCASMQLGLTYQSGVDGVVKKNLQKANQYFKSAANRGSTNAMVLLGILHEEDGQLGVGSYKIGRNWYQKAADKGNLWGLQKLADSYMYAVSSLKDYAEAKELYEKAAELGSKNAITELGHIYQKGKGVEMDYPQAIKYYLQAEMYSYAYSLIEQVLAREDVYHISKEELDKQNSGELLEALKNFPLDKAKDVPPIMFLTQKLLKENIDIMELHFNYSMQGKGFDEAKNDFFNKLI